MAIIQPPVYVICDDNGPWVGNMEEELATTAMALFSDPAAAQHFIDTGFEEEGIYYSPRPFPIDEAIQMVTRMGTAFEVRGAGGRDGVSHSDFFYWNPEPGLQGQRFRVLAEMLEILHNLQNG